MQARRDDLDDRFDRDAEIEDRRLDNGEGFGTGGEGGGQRGEPERDNGAEEREEVRCERPASSARHDGAEDVLRSQDAPGRGIGNGHKLEAVKGVCCGRPSDWACRAGSHCARLTLGCGLLQVFLVDTLAKTVADRGCLLKLDVERERDGAGRRRPKRTWVGAQVLPAAPM